MTKPILYGTNLSAPVRSVLLVANAIGLDIEFKEVNLLEKEHLQEDFLKINPQHTVPTLEDNGFVIWDSHAIATYLIGKYGKDDSLYPKDLGKRALVDQRMHFDSGVLFPRLRGIAEPIIVKDNPVIPAEKIAAVYEAYEFLETFLENDLYLVGDTMTVADLCSVASVSSFHGIAPVNPKKYPKLQAWLDRMSRLPYYDEVNGKGAREVGILLNEKIKELLSKRERKPSETLSQ